jgi:hypothetical protein
MTIDAFVTMLKKTFLELGTRDGLGTKGAAPGHSGPRSFLTGEYGPTGCPRITIENYLVHPTATCVTELTLK